MLPVGGPGRSSPAKSRTQAVGAHRTSGRKLPAIAMARLKALIRQWRWALAGAAILVSAVLGFIGMGEVRSPASTPPLPDRVWDTFLLFRMSSPFSPPYPWPLEVARWLAPATIIYAAVRAVGAVFAQQMLEYRVRLGASGHVVVCGLGDFGARLAAGFAELGHRVVVVEKTGTAPAVAAAVQQVRAQGTTVLTGDAADPEVLGRAAVHRAQYLVAVCGEDEVNAAVAVAARRLVSAHQGSYKPARSARRGGLARRPWRGDRYLRCFVQVGDDHLGRLLEEAVLADPSGAAQGAGGVRLEFFNVVRSGLKALLDEHGAVLHNPEPPHIVVVGSGRFARQLVAEAARRWRLLRSAAGHSGFGESAVGSPSSFPAGATRRQPGDLGQCQITLVAPDASQSVKLLYERFPTLANACHLDAVEADPADPESPPLKIGLHVPAERCLAVVCTDGDDAGAVRASIAVRRALPPTVGLVIATLGESAVPELLRAGSAGFPNAAAFSLLDRACTPQVLLNGIAEEIAQSVHADYVRRRLEELRRAGAAVPKERSDGPVQPAGSLYLRQRRTNTATPDGDPALLPWDQLPETLRESNRDQAADIGRKLALVGCHLEPSASWEAMPREFSPAELELLARAEHDRWCEERQRNGWQWGPERDVEHKRHPDLVPWEQLSERAKNLDRDAVRAVPLFLARLGYAIVPSLTATAAIAAPEGLPARRPG